MLCFGMSLSLQLIIFVFSSFGMCHSAPGLLEHLREDLMMMQLPVKLKRMVTIDGKFPRKKFHLEVSRECLETSRDSRETSS